jgi:hypothetical protein
MGLKMRGGGDRAMTKWEPMELRYLGDVADVILGGGAGGPANGKSQPIPGDPGEPTLKPPGHE